MTVPRQPDATRGPAVPRDPFDPGYATSVMQEVLGPIVQRYFRPRLIGARRTPAWAKTSSTAASWTSSAAITP